MKHTTHAQTQQEREQQQDRVQPEFPNRDVTEKSLDRPRLYAHWVEIDGKLTCQWYSD